MKTIAVLLGILCRAGVGSVFIYASLDKLSHPDGFAQAVYHYRMVPMTLLHPFALLLPMVELVLGIALILGWARRGAALLGGTLSLVFIVALSIALARGLDISCGCFHTDGGHQVGMSLLVRDAVLLLACLPPLILERCGPEMDSIFRRK